jgi:ABC-type multidrug transport system ATPase subunit
MSTIGSEQQGTATSDGLSSITGGDKNQHDRRFLYSTQAKEDRSSHLYELVKRQKARDKFLEKIRKGGKKRLAATDEAGGGGGGGAISASTEENYDSGSASTVSDVLSPEEREQVRKEAKSIAEIDRFREVYGKLTAEEYPIAINISNVSFSVQFTEGSSKIKTVYNSSLIYNLVTFFKKSISVGSSGQEDTKDVVHTKYVLENVSLSLKPGKMYLLLGPPASGKSSLLKAIAGRLKVDEKKGDKFEGLITYNGAAMKDENLHIENAIAFIDQLDRHAPLYTVKETFEFAFQCVRHNGRHCDFRFLPPELDTPENRALAQQLDREHVMVQLVLKSLQIDHVADTFVGNELVRGVSGGQRRRVTAGEMMMNTTPVLCGDEISNGLDASSTFEIVNTLMHTGRVRNRVSVISLLQPSPETVALFDEVIVIAEGKILFAGPVHDVEEYFASLGYHAPAQMDIADFLQVISSPDGAKVFRPSAQLSQQRGTVQPYTIDELAQEFANSGIGKNIKAEIGETAIAPNTQNGDRPGSHLDGSRYKAKYANNFFRSMWLNLKRELTIWRRNKRVLIANTIKNVIMGVSVGGVFFQTDDPVSILGVLFQGMLFVMLSGMAVAPGFVDERIVFYKHADANFFSAFPFVVAKALSKLPQVSVCPWLVS